MSLAALVLAGTFLQAASLQAKTFVVSKSGINCYPSVKGPLYSTIKAAVDAVPIAINGANLVIVCAGTYPEQLKITKNVTIQGVLRDGTDPPAMDGNSNEAKIVVPATGLVGDPDLPGSMAAQVSVMNIADVNLINLRIDGTGVGCPVDVSGVPVPIAGIALYNVGNVGTPLRGTVSRSVVHNQIGYCPDAGGILQRSYMGRGIVAEGSWFTLDSNSLSNADLQLVHQIGGISKITSNSLNLGWHGIKLDNATAVEGTDATGSTVSYNIVSSLSTGLYLVGSSNVLMSSNTVTNWSSDAIALTNGASDNDILSNKIVDAWHGIYINNGSTRNLVKSNSITRSVQVAIIDTFSGGGNVITTNTINQSPVGIWTYLPADDTINPNTFYNVKTLNANGPAVP